MTPFTPRRKRCGLFRRNTLVLLLALALGCRPSKPPDYQDESGLRFTPPTGWVERAHPSAVPDASGAGRKPARDPNLPLPHLDQRVQERLLVRYDRLTAGQLAWLRLSVADVAASVSLEKCLATHAPGPNWRAESAGTTLEVSGQTAARLAWTGRWMNQDYVCETVAVRRGEQVYFIAASFPAADATAREDVRRAIAGAVWH